MVEKILKNLTRKEAGMEWDGIQTSPISKQEREKKSASRQDAASSTGAESRWLACRPVTALTLTPMHQIKSPWISLACLSVPELNPAGHHDPIMHTRRRPCHIYHHIKRKFKSTSKSLCHKINSNRIEVWKKLKFNMF